MLNDRQERRVAAILQALPSDRSAEYYEGMLFGYKQAVVGIYADIDHFANECETWDVTTYTALAIERKIRECKKESKEKPE